MPAPFFMSSGDLIADKRYDFARDLQLRGDLEGAADLMAQAAELAPNFASAWFALGELKQELNLHGEAIKAYRKAIEADPLDRHGAKLRLMRLGVEKLSDMPPAYVQSLFDQYAPRFEDALINDLGYRGPQVLLNAVVAACHTGKRPPFFKRALDLGCGTGLAARAFARNADEFVGIDLSPGMIAKARQTGLYARLEVADMVQGLAHEPAERFDLVLSADAIIYLPDLAPVLKQIARVLQPGGIAAFTTETHSGDGVIIGAGFRYAHGAKHVRDAIAAGGLTLCRLEDVSTRNENNAPVPGLVAIARKP
ncbi:MAG: methyltransferase domain-containing protein [Bradyrhizobiaceae bacterium]|nr:MAG: methyltransferase domain-containing protein [Bradyrhizobiaceae bacterium]